MEDQHGPTGTEPERPVDMLIRRIGDRKPTEEEMQLLMLHMLLELQGDD